MGNDISKGDPIILQKLEKNKLTKNYVQIIELEKSLLLKLMNFYNHYKSIFAKKNLDDFYRAIHLAYYPSLTSLSIDELNNKYSFLYSNTNTNISKNKKKKINVILQFEPKEDTLFSIDSLRGIIENYFFDKEINWKNKNLQNVHSPSFYIQPHILQLGGDIPNNKSKSNNEIKKEIQKMEQQTTFDNRRKFSNFRGNRGRFRGNRGDFRGDRGNRGDFRGDRGDFRGFRGNRGRPGNRGRNDYRERKKQNLLEENENDENNENTNENNSVNENNENINYSNKIGLKQPEKSPNEILNVLEKIKIGSNQTTNTTPISIKIPEANLSSINKLPEKNANQELQVINNKLQKEIQNVILQNTTNQLNQLNELNQKIIQPIENINLNQNKQINKENRNKSIQPSVYSNVFINKCNNSTKICRLTKKEIVKKVVYYYQVKFFIILAILSFIQYYPNTSYYFYRIQQIVKSKFCIPPNYLEVSKMSKKTRLKHILQYISHNSKEKCESKSGFYRILNIPLTLNNDVQKILSKLRKMYAESLKFFINVVDYLIKDREINISQLNILSQKTRDVLSSLYTMCELYYLIIVSISLDQLN